MKHHNETYIVSLYHCMILYFDTILYQFVSHTHMTYAACNDVKACTAYLVCDMKAGLQRLEYEATSWGCNQETIDFIPYGYV